MSNRFGFYNAPIVIVYKYSQEKALCYVWKIVNFFVQINAFVNIKKFISAKRTMPATVNTEMAYSAEISLPLQFLYLKFFSAAQTIFRRKWFF